MGVNSLKMDGNLIEKVFLNTKKIINNIRNSSSPFLIELKTYRNLEHCGPNNDDDLGYRKKKYLNFWKKKCPIKNYISFLKNKKYLSNINEINIEKKIEKEITKAFKFAKESKFPKKELLNKFIYAK